MAAVGSGAVKEGEAPALGGEVLDGPARSVAKTCKLSRRLAATCRQSCPAASDKKGVQGAYSLLGAAGATPTRSPEPRTLPRCEARWLAPVL